VTGERRIPISTSDAVHAFYLKRRLSTKKGAAENPSHGRSCKRCIIRIVECKSKELTGEETMEPRIDATSFGSITIAGETIEHDVIIRLGGKVKKRKKKLSKRVFGTSHRISLAEAKHVFEEGAEQLIIGAGQYGLVQLDAKAQQFLDAQSCHIVLLPTPEAIHLWNRSIGKVIGLFHVTC
jgi:hypothetical protein